MPRTRSNGADVEVILNPPESTQAFRVVRLGVVEAPDEKAAEAAAVEQFGLDEEQRRRLAVREQD